MTQPEEHDLGSIPVGSLDYANTIIAAQALHRCAECIEKLDKPAYQPALEFLQTFAGVLYMLALAKAKAEGLKPREDAPAAGEYNSDNDEYLN